MPRRHSVGGVVAIGGPLINGGSVDIGLFLGGSFLGRCCPPRLHGGPRYRRALPRAGRRATTRRRKTHRLRIAISNGLSQDVWREFLDRFGPLRVPEFCASTEGNVWLYDLQGKIRSIGGIPPYLTSREYGDIRVKLYCI
jgi:hypothetical protein